MSWERWVLDASMGWKGGMFTFCPIEGDFTEDYKIVIGMNYLSDMPPEYGELVAIIHPDGQEAVEEFCGRYSEQLGQLRRRLEERESPPTGGR